MLKSLGKKEILEVLSLFDTYELNGGVYPLYMWIITKSLKIAFYGVLPLKLYEYVIYMQFIGNVFYVLKYIIIGRLDYYYYC